ncbi:protein SOB FIVE-LIKE 2-like [Zingiber officinale]|uniref:protein SOB FIVE-LIKE 2-like n=1 Tax=Zingiber officinale TaxID=94328 RepID=UPI001C4BCF31|nr:protein SOB FIVE-LIKE 2-like [Zingiber officinale]
MDHNDVVGDHAEGLSSSESGWTEYISSPIQDNYGEADGYSEVGDDEEDDDEDDSGDQEDGDSVASDASTGQLLHQSQYSSLGLSTVDEDTRDGQTVKEQQRDFKALKGRGDEGKAPAGATVSASTEGAAAHSEVNMQARCVFD